MWDKITQVHTIMPNETTILDTPDQIQFARLATLKAGLKLEQLGLKKRGQTCYSILRTMGYKGSRQKVYEDVCRDVQAWITKARQDGP